MRRCRAGNERGARRRPPAFSWKLRSQEYPAARLRRVTANHPLGAKRHGRISEFDTKCRQLLEGVCAQTPARMHEFDETCGKAQIPSILNASLRRRAHTPDQCARVPEEIPRHTRGGSFA
jgi:hypothetical protein